jgi:hypothetical protein
VTDSAEVGGEVDAELTQSGHTFPGIVAAVGGGFLPTQGGGVEVWDLPGGDVSG